jgi:hypothetical protein
MSWQPRAAPGRGRRGGFLVGEHAVYPGTSDLRHEYQLADVATYLNRDLLAGQWPVLRTLTGKTVRGLWESAFPELRTDGQPRRELHLEDIVGELFSVACPVCHCANAVGYGEGMGCCAAMNIRTAA